MSDRSRGWRWFQSLPVSSPCDRFSLLSSRRSARSPAPRPRAPRAEGHGAAHRERARSPRPIAVRSTRRRTACSPCRRSSFDKAFAFDRATLLALEARHGEGAAARSSTSPRPLRARCCTRCSAISRRRSVKVSFVAVDGYTGWLKPGRHRPLGLDPRARGRRRAARDRPTGSALADQYARRGEKPSDDAGGHWVWSIFYMKVGE